MTNNSEGPPLENADHLWNSWLSEPSLNTRNELFEFYSPWCRKVSASLFLKFKHSMLDWHDYVHMASLALFTTIEKFNPNRGVPFEAYAYSRIKGEVLDGVRAFTKDYAQKDINLVSDYYQDRLSLNYEAEDSFSTVVDAAIGLAFGLFLEIGILDSTEESDCPQSLYDKESTRTDIVTLVDQLPEKEKFIIKGHYFQHLRFSDLASTLNVTPVRVSQLHKTGLFKLRNLFEESRI